MSLVVYFLEHKVDNYHVDLYCSVHTQQFASIAGLCQFRK